MKLFFHALALSVWLLLATTSTAPAEQADFLFGSLGNADSFIYRYQKTLLTEAFRRNGWTLRIEYSPGPIGSWKTCVPADWTAKPCG